MRAVMLIPEVISRCGVLIGVLIGPLGVELVAHFPEAPTEPHRQGVLVPGNDGEELVPESRDLIDFIEEGQLNPGS